MKKYEFTGETKAFNGTTLHRIRALKDFGDVEAGDLGGWVASEDNLSQEGNCWVYGNARVYGNAWVCGDARVSGDAWVYGNAWVSGDARVSGNAWVSGDARVSGNAWVSGNTQVSGDARVYGYIHVYGNAKVVGDAEIKAPKDTFWTSMIGSRYGTTTFFRCADGKVRVTCGCFYGDLDELAAKVQETHGDNKHGKVYKKLIELAKIQMEEKSPEEVTRSCL